jgi:endoglucanase
VILVLALFLCGCGAQDTARTGSSVHSSAVGSSAVQNVGGTKTAQASSAGNAVTVSSKTSGSEGISVSVQKTNEWEDGKAAYAQFTLCISNNSKSDISDWEADLGVQDGTGLSQSWNCTPSMSGSSLRLKSVGYNKTIKAGTSASDIGIILSCTDSIPEIKSGSVFDYSPSGGTAQSAAVAVNGGAAATAAAAASVSGTTSAEVQPESTSTASYNPKGENKMGSDSSFKVTPLHVDGIDLKDQSGSKVQLKGISSHALALYPQYISEASLKSLRDGWHANVFRLAMYTMEEGGYCNGGDQAKLESVIDTAVKSCVDLNMYVIIDWHILSDGNPLTHEKESEKFFEKMSKKYAGIPNVIYEICNEPNGSDWETQIRPYAEDIIPVIRKNDKNALILVGTNTWSQDVTDVSRHPLEDKNVMYSLHFYAATHKQDLRLKLVKALSDKTPVFISECSICDASGNGTVDRESGQEWMDLIYRYGLSYVEWNLSNKDEASAILKPSCSKTSGYTDADLTETGKWYKDVMSTR